MGKLRLCVVQILISIDQFVQTIVGAVFCLMGLAPVPDADDTISAIVGTRAYEGEAWAQNMAVIIDALFFLEGPDHCYNSRKV